MKERNGTGNLEHSKIDLASFAASYRSGLGTGENDCMSPDLFNELDSRGALGSAIYVCGQGWTLPTVNINGSGCGSGSNWGCGSSSDWGCGSGSGSGGSGSGWGYDCNCGEYCHCPCKDHTWGGSCTGSGSGSCNCNCGSGGSNNALYPGDETGSGASKENIELMDKRKFVPWDNSNCRELCEKILRNYGLDNVGGPGRIIRVASSETGKIVSVGGSESLRKAVNCIDRHLNSRRVIIVGVEYLPDLNPNSDGTDHFIVITGRNYDAQKRQFYYTFMDCATTSVENGCSNSNRLYYWEGHDITGDSKANGRFYTVTHIRPNDGGNYETTSMPLR